jgi:hypothetical protein
MAHTRSLSPCTTLEESFGEDVTTFSTEGILGASGPLGCNVVTTTDPIIDEEVPEGTLTIETIPTVMVWMAAPQPSMELLPDQQQAYQEQQQVQAHARQIDAKRWATKYHNECHTWF